MIFIDQIKDLKKRLASLHNHLAIEAKISSIQEEELKTQQDNFWNDSQKAELIMKRIKTEQKWVNQYNAVKSSLDDLETLHEFYLDQEVQEEEMLKLSISMNMKNHYYNIDL